MSNLRNKILGARDLKADLMEIPEWDGVTIEVRGMSGKARAKFVETAFQNGLTGEPDQAKMGAAMLPLFPEFVLDGVYDPDSNERVFQASDLEALLAKNGDVIQRIAMKVIELSGLNSTENAKGETISAVDAAAKN